MAGRLEGKVAVITGAARGQGKSHCIRLAEEGANIIAVDLQEQIDTVAYPLGSPDDMADTVAQVEALDRRILAYKADVRERHQLRDAIDAGVAELGRLDIVCANAGILPVKHPHSAQHFVDAMDVDFGGVMNAVAVTLPHLGEGASIILTGSTAGMMPKTLTNPALGMQRGFAGAMADFAATALGAQQPELAATSFVIASPDARRVMESTFDAEYTYLGAGALDDRWWARAAATGLLEIANHSWDHLHPALARVAHSRQARADFTQVLTEADADAQIRAAAAYIAERTGGRAAPYFAYPFGHYNEFLTRDYLPRHGEDAGVRAAFTTEPRALRAGDSRWCLPRLTCGHHWTSPAALLRILASA